MLAANKKGLMICFVSAGIGTCQNRNPDIPYTLIPGDVASSIILASMASTAAGRAARTALISSIRAPAAATLSPCTSSLTLSANTTGNDLVVLLHVLAV